MADPASDRRFVFPRWANYLLPMLVVGALGGAAYMPVLVGLGGSPWTTDVGYMPNQPVPFSHAVHAGQLGMDCRYCHTTVESAAFAAIPPTATCLNCHAQIKTDSPKLQLVRDSWTNNMSIEWVKVHSLPDFAYFNHAAHVNKGVGCVDCHGRVDQMEVVYQAQPLSMAWCIDCHREPEKHLRPADQVTNMAWTVDQLPQTNPELYQQVRQAFGVEHVTQKELGLYLKNEKYKIHSMPYMVSCSTCHR
jgi:hypothetical protein